MRMVVGEFFFLVTKSLKSGRLDLPSNHEICLHNFSFSKLYISRNFVRRQISPFLFSKLEKWIYHFSTYLFSVLFLASRQSGKSPYFLSTSTDGFSC